MPRAPKTDGEQAPVVENTETQAPVEGVEDVKKVYHFTSSNKWLTCAGLGIQFIDGKASTENLEIAKQLVNFEGVDLVEE